MKKVTECSQVLDGYNTIFLRQSGLVSLNQVVRKKRLSYAKKKCDKSSEVVIWDKDHYLKEAHNHLSGRWRGL